MKQDAALQLLLLVDYVFDWARDIYRQKIIDTLRLLASGDNDAASMMPSDTALLTSRQADTIQAFSSAPENDDYQTYTSRQNAFISRGSKSYAVRHATFVESRYCCVILTGDNVRTMLYSMHEKETK